MNHIQISISQQTLSFYSRSTTKVYSISSAANGIGNEEGSHCTPVGNFIIAEKHGIHAPLHTIFKARKPMGVWDQQTTGHDLILSRILWLEGADPDNLNTKQRYIYIHGTNHEDLIGAPHSCGCIRMKNEEVVDLYEVVEIGTPVKIST